MKTDFINREEFLQEMNLQWEEFGNCPSEKFDNTWTGILDSFNSQIRGDKGLHVCDSVCGSGKTLSMEVASSLLCKNWDDIGTLIVVRLTDQCVDIAQRINEISERLYGRSVAKPFFSGTHQGVRGQLTEGEQLEAQVLVVTHSRYMSSVSGKGSSFFRKWKAGTRRFRVVDESLDLVERFHLTRPEMVELSRVFELRRDYADSFIEQFEPHLYLFDQIKRFFITRIRQEGRYSKEFCNLIEENRVNGNEIYFSEIAEVLMNSTEKDYEKRKWKEGEFETFLQEGIQSLNTLDRLIRRTIYFCEESGDKKYSTGQIILPNDFESLCVLDATSNVDEVYRLFKKHEQIQTYKADRSVRNFRNCTIHIRPSKGLGLGATKKKMIPRVQKVSKWAKENFLPTDKVLFSGHKVMMEQLKNAMAEREVDFQYDFCWWNAIDGKNEWKDFNKLVVLSLNYLPTNYGPTTAIGFEDINPDVLDNHTGIADSSMAVKVIQLLARIRTRTVINKEGDCPLSDVFLLLPTNDEMHPDFEEEQDFEEVLDSLGKYILTEIKSSMNGVKTSKWISFPGFETYQRPGKESIQDRFIAWIRTMKPGDVRERSQFESDITDKELKSLRASFVPNSKITRQLTSFNINVVSTRGRNGKTTFTRLEN